MHLRVRNLQLLRCSTRSPFWILYPSRYTRALCRTGLSSWNRTANASWSLSMKGIPFAASWNQNRSRTWIACSLHTWTSERVGLSLINQGISFEKGVWRGIEVFQNSAFVSTSIPICSTLCWTSSRVYLCRIQHRFGDGIRGRSSSSPGIQEQW